MNYTIMATKALKPYLSIIKNPWQKAALIEQWTRWFQRSGVTDQQQADELVACTVKERVCQIHDKIHQGA